VRWHWQEPETRQAEKIAAKLDTEFPRSTMVQNYWLPTIRAAIELQNSNANKALELLERTVPYELGFWTWVICIPPIFAVRHISS
jgi:hypothetical protein